MRSMEMEEVRLTIELIFYFEFYIPVKCLHRQEAHLSLSLPDSVELRCAARRCTQNLPKSFLFDFILYFCFFFFFGFSALRNLCFFLFYTQFSIFASMFEQICFTSVDRYI